jgi:hypothetical protein
VPVTEPVARSENSGVPVTRPRRMIRTSMTMWTPKQTRRALALRTRPRAKTSLRIWRSKWSQIVFIVPIMVPKL